MGQRLQFTAEHYRTAAMQRVQEAWTLHGQQRHGLALYVAGVAVECILRAYRTRRGRQFSERHDLNELLKESGIVEFVSNETRQTLPAHLGTVWANWNNDYRFGHDELIRATLRKQKQNRMIKGDPLKELSRQTINAALEIVTQGASQWPRR